MIAVLDLQIALNGYIAQVLDIRLLVAAVIGVGLLLIARWAISR